MERQIKRQQGTGEGLREKPGKPGRRSGGACEQEDRQRRQGSWVRRPALLFFGGGFHGAIIFVSEERQWHLSLTLEDGYRTAFAQRLISIMFQEYRIWHQEAWDSTTSPKSG